MVVIDEPELSKPFCGHSRCLDIVLEVVLDIVRSWTGTLRIHPGLLDFFFYSQNFCQCQGTENDGREPTTPNDDKGDLGEVCSDSIACGHKFRFAVFFITRCAEPTPAMVLVGSCPKIKERSSNTTPNAPM